MLTVRTDFAEKEAEVQSFLSFIEDAQGERGSIQKTAILKASFMIVLYNVVEATMTSVLTRLHEEFTTRAYDELSSTIKFLYVRYYFYSRSEQNCAENLTNVLGGNAPFPSFTEYSNRVTLFSGNVDAKKISEILKLYGMKKLRATLKNRNKLLIVKNKRNKLAHGEDSFRESCRGLTLNEIREITEAVILILKEFLDLAQAYLDGEAYLKQT